jgi:hypothetical protein
MAKWIVFDDDSVLTLSRQGNSDVEVGVGDPISVALATEAPALVMLPGSHEQVTVVTLYPGGTPRPRPHHYVAAGFLGLTDEIAAEDDIEEDEKRPWWRRIFGG